MKLYQSKKQIIAANFRENEQVRPNESSDVLQTEEMSLISVETSEIAEDEVLLNEELVDGIKFMNDVSQSNKIKSVVVFD